MACVSAPLIETAVAFGESPCTDGGQPCPLHAIASQVLNTESDTDILSLLAGKTVGVLIIRETVPPSVSLPLLDQVRQAAPDLPVVALAIEADADMAVRFIRAGASDYFRGPLTQENLHRVAAVARPRAAVSRIKDEWYFPPDCPASVPIVGRSPAMQRALELMRQVARSRLSPILILGETGTGKELAARAIHALRGGTPRNFVAVNCATLTPTLLESELFGHTKGSFTGADRDKTGLFELADTGTIFLDEVSEMPVGLQAKLLRVLQEREFRRVGGTRNIPCRATVIASSNRDLATEIREGRFRADLYYRLAVFPIVMPPLRDPSRRDDIPVLAEYFLQTAFGEPGAPRKLSEAAQRILVGHNWPGNVRELRNVLERAVILTSGSEITPETLLIDGLAPQPPAARPADAPPQAAKPAEAPPQDFALETAERMFILRALEETGWQRTRAATLLGITRATLHAKLKRYKITLPEMPRTSESAILAVRPGSRMQETYQ
jgi:DNA-binding NtrC family response regulator